MVSLSDRLLSVEEDFLASMLKGDDAMFAFDQRWQTLLDDIDLAMESNTTTIDDDIPALAFAVASRVATLADVSVALFTTCDAISSDLVDQLGSLMSELRMDDPHTPNPPELNVPPSKSHHLEVHNHILSSSRKRRRQSSEDLTDAVPQRYRTSSPRSNTPIGRSFPLSPPPIVPSAHFIAHSESTSVSRISRKRRCSDADTSNFPSDCKRLCVGPRLHAVSDSFVLPRTSTPEKSSPAHPHTQPLLDTHGASTPVEPSSTLPIPLHLDMLPDLELHGSPDLTSLLSATEVSLDSSVLSMMLPTTDPFDDVIREWSPLGEHELFIDTFIPLPDSPFSSASTPPCPTPLLMPALDLGAPLYEPLNLTSSGIDWCLSRSDGHSCGISPSRFGTGDRRWAYDQVGGKQHDDGLADDWSSLVDSLHALQSLPLLCCESGNSLSEQLDSSGVGIERGPTLNSSQLGIIACS